MVRSVLLLPLFFSACSGDDGEPVKDGLVDDTAGDADTDTDSDADTDTDTDTDTKTDSAPDDTAGPPPAPPSGYTGPNRVVLVVDGASGSGSDPASVVIYDPEGSTSTTVAGLTVRGDSIADCTGDSLFVLETRAADGASDHVIRINPTDGSYEEWELGSNFKPQDVEAAGPEYWVAAWGKPRLLTYDNTGAAGAQIDISSVADADGIPEANGLLFAGGVVYLTVARQGQTDGSYNGAKVVEIDAAGHTINRSVDLSGTFPTGKMIVAADKLQVHLRSTVAADFSYNTDGGVEAVDIAGWADGGLTVDDSSADVTQTVAFFEAQSGTVWRAYADSSGAPSVGAWSLFDGSASQHWPVADQVVGLGLINGTVWEGENPYGSGDGALVSRDPTGGDELSRVALTGRVRSVAVCAAQVPPEGGGEGGEP